MATPEHELLQRLLRRAHLFDDPSAYEAGVRDAVELLGEVRHEDGDRQPAAMASSA